MTTDPAVTAAAEAIHRARCCDNGHPIAWRFYIDHAVAAVAAARPIIEAEVAPWLGTGPNVVDRIRAALTAQPGADEDGFGGDAPEPYMGPRLVTEDPPPCATCGHERRWHIQPGVNTTDCVAWVPAGKTYDACTCPAYAEPSLTEDVSDQELPGMWETADFEGPDVVRGAEPPMTGLPCRDCAALADTAIAAARPIIEAEVRERIAADIVAVRDTYQPGAWRGYAWAIWGTAARIARGQE